ncbi:MAG: hypothetical protein DRJ65_15845 [Acidobacteria bacterium]|nr:MAG: hypothetical protein DRJ65_15845 [Acidobacteriota bacterium]
MNTSLHVRARKVRSLVAIRSWEYRQRNHSKGVWFRLRRVLADAESVFAVSHSEVQRLEEEGYKREPVGAEIEPQKVILFVPATRLEQISEKRRLRVALDAEFFAAPNVVLRRFED